MTTELNKHFKSETIEVSRSHIRPSPYNPRTISVENRASLKRGIKKYGVIGGLVWNAQTGYLVSGHQRLSVLDEVNGYKASETDTDYCLKVEKIDVDIKIEKELNILFNNPNAMGSWDYDALRDMLPDINYKDAGFTDADMAMMGIVISNSAIDDIISDMEIVEKPYEERKKAVKDMKQKIKENAQQKAEEHYSHVTLVFDDYKHKSAFMLRFGFAPIDTYIQGKAFGEMIEKVE